MKDLTHHITIIGAGLTGLTLAYKLKQRGISYALVEARKRIGGRILTKYVHDGSAIELGATWYGNQHTQLFSLLKELNIESFDQILGDQAIYEPLSTSPVQLVTMPPNDSPSYRISGGTFELIRKLKGKLDDREIFLNEPVNSIKMNGNGAVVETGNFRFSSKIVVSTLPPCLLFSKIEMDPKPSSLFYNSALKTNTWMGESIKVGLIYKTPFWREKNSSGTIFSNVGPIPEMYDHGDIDDNYFSLMGFINSAFYSVSKKERLELVLNQLERYYGPIAREYLSYQEKVWREDKFTFVPYDSHVLPHENNGNAIYQEVLFNGKLIIGGSETSTEFPGYMEGAVRSAKTINQLI